MKTKAGLRILSHLITIILSSIDKETAKRACDSFLDIIEETAAKSSTKIDDAVVLPLCRTARKVFDIPEFDDEN